MLYAEQQDHDFSQHEVSSALLFGGSFCGGYLPNLSTQSPCSTDDVSLMNMFGTLRSVSVSEIPDYGYYTPDIVTLSASVASTDAYSSDINDECKIEPFEQNDTFRSKSIKQWDSNDILKWLYSEADEMKIFCTDINGPNFCKFDGFRLLEMTEADFIECDDKYGKKLYKQFKKIISEQKQPSLPPILVQDSMMGPTYTTLNPVKKVTSSCENGEATNNSSTHSTNDERQTFNNVKSGKNIIHSSALNNEGEKKKRPGPGRPKLQRKKKKQEKKLGRLWEFIRDLLKDKKYCPNLICWENHDEGMFRFVHSDRVANLWGSKKGNNEMNYEKLSRAMRYYYKSEVLLPVIGRRLVYKFGPNAKNWRVDNPNFKN